MPNFFLSLSLSCSFHDKLLFESFLHSGNSFASFVYLFLVFLFSSFRIMNNIAMYIPGIDEDSRILRRTLMRYLNLTLVLVLRSISIAVKRRFPTKEHLVEAGMFTRKYFSFVNNFTCWKLHPTNGYIPLHHKSLLHL